jgi:hypothetical protein
MTAGYVGTNADIEFELIDVMERFIHVLTLDGDDLYIHHSMFDGDMLNPQGIEFIKNKLGESI